MTLGDSLFWGHGDLTNLREHLRGDDLVAALIAGIWALAVSWLD